VRKYRISVANSKEGGGERPAGYHRGVSVSRPCLEAAAGHGGIGVWGSGKAIHGFVMGESRCGGDFLLILSETPCKNRRFCHSPLTEVS
jgi:hypothetical protein